MPLYSFPLLVSTMYTCHGRGGGGERERRARRPWRARATVCTLRELAGSWLKTAHRLGRDHRVLFRVHDEPLPSSRYTPPRRWADPLRDTTASSRRLCIAAYPARRGPSSVIADTTRTCPPSLAHDHFPVLQLQAAFQHLAASRPGGVSARRRRGRRAPLRRHHHHPRLAHQPRGVGAQGARRDAGVHARRGPRGVRRLVGLARKSYDTACVRSLLGYKPRVFSRFQEWASGVSREDRTVDLSREKWTLEQSRRGLLSERPPRDF